MKTTVIYHSADFDGIFCREIARRFLGETDVEYIGWNFGDPLVQISSDVERIYVLDLSPDCLSWEVPSEDPFKRLIWIDHHKTSIEKWPKEIQGCRIDGVAACRLAWQWFRLYANWDHRELHPPYDLPAKQDYVDRSVLEPLAVRLAGEYDIWDKRDPRAETFQYGLRTWDPDRIKWKAFFSPTSYGVYGALIRGRIAQAYAQLTDASICKARTWLMEWEGLKFLCVNSARFNSLFFAARDIPETGHDALLGFCFDGRQWTVSLYHAKHHTDLDLSVIAKKHGGGGHKGACGFTCKTLPFQLV